jgi:hypothetical protein
MDDLIKENRFLKSQLVQNEKYIENLLTNLSRQLELVDKLNKEILLYEASKSEEDIMLKNKIARLETELSDLSGSKSSPMGNETGVLSRLIDKLKSSNDQLVKENLELNKQLFELNLKITELDGQYKMKEEQMQINLERSVFQVERLNKKISLFESHNCEGYQGENANSTDDQSDLNDLFDKYFSRENNKSPKSDSLIK